jgi:hypothetical protein
MKRLRPQTVAVRGTEESHATPVGMSIPYRSGARIFFVSSPRRDGATGAPIARLAGLGCGPAVVFVRRIDAGSTDVGAPVHYPAGSTSSFEPSLPGLWVPYRYFILRKSHGTAKLRDDASFVTLFVPVSLSVPATCLGGYFIRIRALFVVLVVVLSLLLITLGTVTPISRSAL